jgi:hypothetical protein
MVMEYIATTNKNELDLVECGYYEFYPGIFKKVFWNENSMFVSDALIDIVEDILENSNEGYSTFDDFAYFDVEKINNFECKLSTRINEITNNKKIFDVNMEYLNKEIEENKSEIIEMLNKLFLWIKSNKEKGISIATKFRNYKILTIKDLPDGCGGYLEFLPGKFNDKCWNDNSVFIEEGELDIVDDLLWKVNSEYDRHGFEYYYDENLINRLENELQNRLNEIINNGYILKGVYSQEFYDNINTHMDLYKEEMIEMLGNFILWLKTNKSNGITVIGM